MYGLWLLGINKNMNNFSRELREQVFVEQEGVCYFYGKSFCGGNNGLSFHHVCSNTKTNRRIFGNKNIQSKYNCVMLCVVCHTNYTHLLQHAERRLTNRWIDEKR